MLKMMLHREDSQRRFLAQHSAAMLEQCCNHSKQCRNNVARLCCNITLTDEGNENGEKTTIGLISKKATLHVQHTFFVHFFAIVLHDYNVKLPETS